MTTERTALLETVLGAASVGLVVLDPEMRVVLWNRWMENHSALLQKDVRGHPFFGLFPGFDNKRVEAAVAQALQGYPSVLSQTLHKSPFPLFEHAGAERIAQAVTVTPIEFAGSARHCLIQVTDVTAAAQRERLLRDQAMVLRTQTFSDGLTGIANRRHFDVAMEKEIRRSRRAGTALSLLMIDIDFFKAYNDHYGHQQGDECLKQVARELASMLHRPLDLIARYGGEEFAVILPEMDADPAQTMAQALRARVLDLAIPHEQGGPGKQITVSIGLCTQGAGQQIEIPAMIGAADKALYEAKRAGRDRIIVGTACISN